MTDDPNVLDEDRHEHGPLSGVTDVCWCGRKWPGTHVVPNCGLTGTGLSCDLCTECMHPNLPDEASEALQRAARRHRDMVVAGVLKGPGNVVTVPVEGTWLVTDGVVRRCDPLPVTAFVELSDGRTFLTVDGVVRRVNVGAHFEAFGGMPELWEVAADD